MTTQTANLRTYLRTNPTGPRNASAVATQPNRIFQNATPPKPNSCSESALAPVAMMISSNTAQPRHWSTFSPVGRYEPLRPSGARNSTIVGTRASAPISPPTPSRTLPTTAAATIAASACGSESASPNSDAGSTRNAPATITSSETDRFAHKRKPSNAPSTRRRSGTGSMPQDGVSVSLTYLPSPA